MDTPTFAWKVFELFSPAALAGLTWLSVRVAQLLTARIKGEQATRMLLLVDSVALAAAREVQQVLVDNAKAKNADGSLTAEQSAQAKQAALDSAKAQLGAQRLADVAATFGYDVDVVDRVLGIRIEAAVHRLKRATHVASDPGTAGDAVPFAA